MSETLIWKAFEPLIRADGGDCTRHEDKYRSGIPDISYGLCGINGWIESKFLESWPKKPTTPVKFKDFPDTQRRWLVNRDKSGGNCYIILLVGRNKRDREFLMFKGRDAHTLGSLTKGGMYDLSVFEGVTLYGVIDHITRF